MQLTYTDAEDKLVKYKLGDAQVVIGRAPDADIVIDDEKVSRYHASLVLWDGDYVLKDLKTANGTKVNGNSVTVAQLTSGSIITVGAHEITFVDENATHAGRGPNTVIRKVSREMESGKGFGALMREIVHDVETTDEEKPDPDAS